MQLLVGSSILPKDAVDIVELLLRHDAIVKKIDNTNVATILRLYERGFDVILAGIGYRYSSAEF